MQAFSLFPAIVTQLGANTFRFGTKAVSQYCRSIGVPSPIAQGMMFAACVGFRQTKIARWFANPPFVAATTFGNWINLSQFFRQPYPLGDVLIALKRSQFGAGPATLASARFRANWRASPLSDSFCPLPAASRLGFFYGLTLRLSLREPVADVAADSLLPEGSERGRMCRHFLEIVGKEDQRGRVSMTRYKILGLVISVSLLCGYEPMADAAPVTVPSSAVISNADGLVVQAVIAGGVWRREARRQNRRAIRRHGY
jgi:hypothetical protein